MSGVILTTRGWTGASVLFAHTSGSATFTPTGDTNNAFDVATALAAWLDDAARPWAAALTGLSWSVEDDGAGRCAFVFAFTGTTFLSITGTATWLTRMAISDQSVLVGLTGETRGSASGVVWTSDWERVDAEAGGRARVASWRLGHPATGTRRPRITWLGDLPQTYALSEAFRLASQPRQAYVYDELAETWRRVTVGRHTFAAHVEGDVTRWRCELTALGGT